MDAYIGIDVACKKDKYCPISICVKKDGILIPFQLANERAQSPKGLGNIATLSEVNNLAYAAAIKKYILAICKSHQLNPVCIAIDSPLQPRAEHLKRRRAELELDKRKISCYTTPSKADFDNIIVKANHHIAGGGKANKLPHSMQIFMLAGFAIANALKDVAPCIEIYPHATAKLLDVAGKHKTKDDQAYIQLQALSKFTGWPSTQCEWDQVPYICKGPTHDKVDAYSAAWIASLAQSDRLALGEPEASDAIWLPILEHLVVHTVLQKFTPTAEIMPTKRNKKTPSETKVGEHTKLCPACHAHMFKRWPFGWDAHAAHKCTGVDGVNIEARKRIYKERFL